MLRRHKMAAISKQWTNIDVRDVIRFLHAKGKIPKEFHRENFALCVANK